MAWVAVAVAAVSAYGQYQAGVAADNAAKAQAIQYEQEAEQAEFDAKAALIERKRETIRTMAAQNVGAAAQGRTISSISALQSEDVRRSQYDQTMIEGVGAAGVSGAMSSAANARLVGSQQKQASNISAASSLLGGVSSGYKASTPKTTTPKKKVT